MRKSLVHVVVVIIVLSFPLIDCAPKPKDALLEAEAAIAEAQAQNAESTCPEQYRQAREHLERGREQEFNFRHQQARDEYKAATQAARLAVSDCENVASVGDRGVEGQTSYTVQADSCCVELELCNVQEGLLDKKIRRLNRGGVVRTRVVQEPCPEEEAPAQKTGGDMLMGTFSFEPPPALVKNQTDYTIKVKYLKSRLGDEGEQGAEDDYSILLDIAKVEPPDVEAFSPTADFESLTEGGGVWSLPVNVVEGHKGPVKVTITGIIRNTRTGREQNLPESTITIPDLTSCPRCPDCKEVKLGDAAGGQSGKSDWTMRSILLVFGLVAGLIVGKVMSGRKSKGGPTIKSF